ncbi:YciI family protein [Solimonas marina]|uniref:Dehydrogenase n=1 Tax=Solimonas marina TaxID=2714601 RepID=A0A969W7Y7_9GAMM|nr:YciI family protein [Solimonas marina]NKF22077.1 dehydrogenase [Solimonas marina]
MRYALLIIEPRGQREARTSAEGEAAYASMVAFAEGLQTRGKLLAVESLTADRAGTRVAVRGGKPQVVDGPFAEAKEMIGGFFLLDVESRDEALAIAADCPAAAWATVEVREAGPCFL